MSNISPALAKQLLEEAKAARESSYAPYSQCRVGAALLTADGKIYRGCNIENAAFGPTVCAERVAIFKAVSEGVHDFAAIAVVGGKGEQTDGLFPPCREFCIPEKMRIILEQKDGSPIQLTLSDLLPHSFGPDFL